MNKEKKWTMLSALGGDMLEMKDGYAKGVLPLSDLVMQPTKVFHAGAIVTLADEVASTAIHGEANTEESRKNKLFPYSVQLSVNLFTNDPVGPLTAEAKVVRRGKMTVVETKVFTSDGQTAAIMMSTHMMVDLNKSGPHKKAQEKTNAPNK
jgi:uncharacterized protein (TIGR00369 family)